MSRVYKVELTFTEPMLGTVPLNKEIYTDYVASKAPEGQDTADEVETVSVSDEIEKGTTGFHRLDDGTPCVYDFVVKGFAKDACSMLSRVAGSKSKELKAFKKVIDGLMFVEPRRIPIKVNGKIEILERPLRAQTAQGERVALARSEIVPAGSTMEFTVNILDAISEDVFKEWLTYGRLRGLGCWRNASYGRFHAKVTRADAEA